MKATETSAGESVAVAPSDVDRPALRSEETSHEPRLRRWRQQLWRTLTFIVLPIAALILAAAAGSLKWVAANVVADDSAVAESTRAASETTVALLSYRPETVEQDLGSARDRLTGEFRDSYTALTADVVIPGAREQQISAVATVPAAASLSVTETHASVLLFVNQTTVIGDAAPTESASTVKVTMDKVNGRWLISKFEPI
ncbi:hypothetical protein [Mycobacterium sp. 236(2023)]|uniref:hypothetical protein n=1 Tax=Mycobacterium sp. 236(2023) TaxID=3038163 RepID=UPI0024156C50|nr:hypothetical protein [Mycobacterium sp. 236(2023)]MDG4668059.1 hypothetical protein [Mycobacterium sp. 236(2023)]